MNQVDEALVSTEPDTLLPRTRCHLPPLAITVCRCSMQHGCTEPLRIDGAHHFWGQGIFYLERPYPKNDDYTGFLQIIWLLDAGPLDGARGVYTF